MSDNHQYDSRCASALLSEAWAWAYRVAGEHGLQICSCDDLFHLVGHPTIDPAREFPLPILLDLLRQVEAVEETWG